VRWLGAALLILVPGCARRAPSTALATNARTSCTASPSPDATVYDTTQVTKKPVAVSGPQMPYPDQLRQQGINGHVVLAVTINADGNVDGQSVTVLWRDRPEFEREALRWLRGAQFMPGCIGGNAVRVRIALPFDWRVKS
jgi:TonB family protein